jgi:hypothetical protein
MAGKIALRALAVVRTIFYPNTMLSSMVPSFEVAISRIFSKSVTEISSRLIALELSKETMVLMS